MMLQGLSKLLVTDIEAVELLDGRYKNIKLMSIAEGVRRGNFSLVFKGWDNLEGHFVAIKFFDLDPERQNDYRLRCFEREHGLLLQLKSAKRCLQIESPLNT